MLIAVTGAYGTLGRAVVADLLAHDYRPVAIDRAAAAEPPHDHRLESRPADLTSLDETLAALAGCQAILHLAAIPNPVAAGGHEVFVNNTASTYNVLQAAAQLKIERVIYTSSQSVLGNPWAASFQPLDYVPVDERHPCRLFDLYGLSKRVGEQICDLFARTTNLRLLSFRLPAIWPPEEFERRITGRLTDQLQAAKSIWAYLDIRDAARAYRLALQAGWTGHEIVNITSRWAFGAAPIPDLIEQWYPDLTDIRVELAADTPIFDARKAERLLGFRSRFRWTRTAIEEKES